MRTIYFYLNKKLVKYQSKIAKRKLVKTKEEQKKEE